MWPYLGEPGRLVQVPGTASEDVSREDRYVVEKTVEGRRRAQVRPASPRSWSVDVPLGSGTDISGLEAFAWGAWGRGPWQWITVAAQTGNLLTPQEAMLVDRVSSSALTDAGPVRVTDGTWAARSVSVALSSGWVALTRGIPVIAGKSFTWAVDAVGAGSAPQVQVAFYDAAGVQVATEVGTGAGNSMQRVSVTTTVPAGAVSAWGGVRSTVSRAARPQATWTSQPVPFAPGNGCSAAILDGLSSALRVVSPDGPLSDIGFTVMEVS